MGLFEAVGVELEYMIVWGESLDVLPICDRLIEAEVGSIASDAEHRDITWSNELVLHVVELKTTDPARELRRLVSAFNRHVERVNGRLRPLGGRLMPSAMHPWMDPHRQMHLWPHDNGEVYAAFHRVFDCRGHGWANLQSMHVNLPFDGDEQFGRLHAAVRLILPILPALAAASPIVDGWATGLMDNRLYVYRTNCAAVPACTGRVVPEPVFTIGEYRAQVLEPMYDALAPHDPGGILRDEWANARGAIARFSRNTIEIRVIDVQECPAADLAIAAATVAVLKLLVAEAWSDWATQKRFATGPLADLLDRTIRDADRAVIDDTEYLRAFGYTGAGSCTAGELWRHLIAAARERGSGEVHAFEKQLDVLITQGPLARRVLNALGPNLSRAALSETYRKLCDRLEAGEMFIG